jgi:hypothetical protein
MYQYLVIKMSKQSVPHHIPSKNDDCSFSFNKCIALAPRIKSLRYESQSKGQQQCQYEYHKCIKDLNSVKN